MFTNIYKLRTTNNKVTLDISLKTSIIERIDLERNALKRVKTHLTVLMILIMMMTGLLGRRFLLSSRRNEVEISHIRVVIDRETRTTAVKHGRSWRQTRHIDVVTREVRWGRRIWSWRDWRWRGCSCRVSRLHACHTRWRRAVGDLRELDAHSMAVYLADERVARWWSSRFY